MSKNTLRVEPSVRILRPKRIDAISGPKVICEVAIIGPDGKVKSSSLTEKPSPDLILHQFLTFLSSLIGTRTTGSTFSTTLIDINGSPQTLNYRGLGGTNILMIDNTAGYVGGTIGIGADPTAALRTDHELTSKTAEFEISNEASTESTIIKQGAWLATGSGTVYETGYYIYLTDNTGTTWQFLLFHDIPTPQAYVLNDSVQVTYTIQL